jgi:hypothetical protein
MPLIATRASAAYGAGFSRVVGPPPYAGPFGAYDALASVTVGATAVSTVTFAGIPSDYKHLQIRIMARNNSGTGGLDFIRAKFNSDATSGNYRGHYLYANGSTASVGAVSGATSGLPICEVANNTNTSNAYAVGIADILDYANTSKYKTTRSLTGGDFNDSSGGILSISGLYMSTNAITSIELVSASGTGFIQYSNFSLHGVR